MNRLSLFKFSRYFFVLFLMVTVLPLASLLVWSNYDLEQHLITHQKQFLDMDVRRIHRDFQQQLDMDRTSIAETAQSIKGRDLTLAEYRGVFNVQEVFWLDSATAVAFFRQHPGLSSPLAKTNHAANGGDITGDYFPAKKSIESYFIVPLPTVHRGLLLLKSLPPETFAPNGPYRVAIYAGNQTSPSALMFKSDDMWRHPGFGHDYESTQRYRLRLKGKQPPPSLLSRPDKQPAPWRDPNFNPRLSKILAKKMVHLSNLAGQPIATIDIKAFRPPKPAGFPSDQNTQGIGLFILAAGALSSLLAGNYIRKNFLQPLTQLALVATQVQQGHLDSRVETDTIRQADVRQTLEKVNAMLSDLVEKEQLRNSFISNLTHDFRTPLVAQRRSLELLSQDMQQLNLTEQENLALGLLKNSEHLLKMVNQLLETYQTEAGSFRLKLSPEAIPALVSQCFEQLAPLAEERQITLDIQFPADFPVVMTDVYYLKRVFINLIGNGIENIPKRSRIEVSGQITQPGWVQIHVRDNGLGVSPEEQHQLFERYYAGTGDTRKLGSGLGLYICAVLVSAHQGNISVDSVSGEYTDFIIDLPIIPQKGSS